MINFRLMRSRFINRRTGGPSIGIFRGGSSTATTDATDIITSGTGGQGGPGGTGATAPSGQQDQSGVIVP